MRIPFRPPAPANTASGHEAGTVHLQDVKVRYGAVTALDGFNLQVNAGEFVGVLGRSGAGKTTVLRVIAGFERVASGYVRISGRLASSSFVHVAPDQRRVGVVFQDYALFPHLTVAENVAFGLRDLSRRERDDRIAPIIDLAELKGLEKRYPHELSGGQQQRVALARALSPSPVALLLDEPFSNLDRELRTSLRREVSRIVRQAGATALLVTHDREEALAMSDRVAVMGHANVLQVGTPAEVYLRPISAEVAQMIGPCDLISGRMDGDKVSTEAGLFPADGGTGPVPPDGASVTALLRPSEVELSVTGSGPDVRVRSREFRGEFTSYGLVLPSGQSISVTRRSDEPIELGSRVAVTSRPGSKVIAFPIASRVA